MRDQAGSSGATPPTPVGVGGDGRGRSRPRLLFEALGLSAFKTRLGHTIRRPTAARSLWLRSPQGHSLQRLLGHLLSVVKIRQDPSGATPPTPVGVGGDGRTGPRPRLLFEALGRLRLQDPPRPHDPAPHRREESLAEKPPRGILSRDSSAGSIRSNASYTRSCQGDSRRDPSGATPPTPVGVGGDGQSRSKASTVVRGLGSSPPSRPASATRSGAPPPRGVSG